MARGLRFLLGVVLTLGSGGVWAQQTVRVGVLAFRPVPDMERRWQPLADHLTARIPGYRFRFEPLDYAVLEAVIFRREIDFVITNPSHYVLMTYRNGLSSPLATIITEEKGQPVSRFGGVVFCQAGRDDITGLADLKGKIIATTATGSLGSYQAQALEFEQAGLPIPQGPWLLQTGMPHDKVVQAVLEGRADAGLVRTGLLEAMAAEGRLDLARLKAINLKKSPGFPYWLSTRLYPEWPFAAMPSVNEDLARQVAAELLGMPHGGDLAHRLGLHGFTIPADYEAVRNTLRTLRLPPFDVAPHFTIRDIWNKYWWELLAVTVLSVVIVLLGVLLVMLNRQLAEQRRGADRRAEEWHGLLAALGDGVYGVDARGLCTFINPAALAMLGYSAEDVLGHDQHELFHHHREDGNPYPACECPISLTLKDGQLRHTEEWFVRKDGGGFPIMLTVNPVREGAAHQGAVVVFRDISERRRLEMELREEATTDALTRLPNRRYFLAEMERHLARIHRGEEHPGAVMMLDLDNFKAVNDSHGHAVGDLVLKHFASVLGETLRKSDLAGRLGGEEFAILQADTSLEQAGQFAERLRQRVMASRLAAEGHVIAYTVSIGVSLVTAADNGVDRPLQRADAALYVAKRLGRNRVEYVSPPREEQVASGTV